jgi:hypothetical protein
MAWLTNLDRFTVRPHPVRAPEVAEVQALVRAAKHFDERNRCGSAVSAAPGIDGPEPAASQDASLTISEGSFSQTFVLRMIGMIGRGTKGRPGPHRRGVGRNSHRSLELLCP